MANTYTSTLGSTVYNVELEDARGNTGKLNGIAFNLDTLELREDKYHLLFNNKSYTVEFLKADVAEKSFTILVNGVKQQVQVADKFDALLKSLGLDNLAANKVNELKAPMPGLVLEIRVAEGQEIKKGDPLIVLEAMKMENILKSPTDGKIKKVVAQKGNAVEKNQVLISFE